MRILLINTVATGRNGITMVIFNYLKAMATNGIVFDFVSINTPEPQYVDTIKNHSGSIFVINRSIKCLFSYLIHLYLIVKRGRYDAVHIHGNSHTVVLELFASWLAGCQTRIVHSHNTTCSHILIHKVMTFLFNSLYTNGLACGKKAGEWMFGHAPFCIINNGIDTKMFLFDEAKRDFWRNKLGWSNCKVVGHVGSFNNVKNHKFLIDVFYELYLMDNSYRLLLLGDGELREEIEAKIKTLGLVGVTLLTGGVDNTCDFLNVMDIVVMPSLYEGLPLTLVEQQANGLCCVVSDTITKESDKTGNLYFLSLNKSAKEWANVVLGVNTSNRYNRSLQAVKAIADCGYDLQKGAAYLNDYYKKLGNSY